MSGRDILIEKKIKFRESSLDSKMIARRKFEEKKKTKK
jgi:hypothetical protein